MRLAEPDLTGCSDHDKRREASPTARTAPAAKSTERPSEGPPIRPPERRRRFIGGPKRDLTRGLYVDPNVVACSFSRIRRKLRNTAQAVDAKIVPLNVGEVEALAAVPDWYRALIVFAAGMGMPGRVLGLTVDRVDFLRHRSASPPACWAPWTAP